MNPQTYADLHIHTNHSDGSFAPEDVVVMAHRKGLKAIAITDHDNTTGITEANWVGRRLGVQVIPGIEISTKSDTGGLHIIGLFIDTDEEGIQDYVRKQMRVRREWADITIEKLCDMGHGIGIEDVEKYSASGMLGKKHIARALVQNGVCPDVNTAFQGFLNKGAKAYLGKEKITPEEAIRLIKGAGGISVLAHPGDGKGRQPVTEEEIILLKKIGLDGVELYSQHHTEEQTTIYRRIAGCHGLLATGGSDFHDEDNGDIGGPGLSEGELNQILDHLRHHGLWQE